MRFLLLMMVLSALAGCTGLEPAVIGAAAGATEAGVAVYSKGRISAAAIEDYDDVRLAVRQAAEDLSLEMYFEREDEVWSRYSMRDERRKSFTVYVRRRTATMTQLDIDVGRFGNEAIGRLLLLRIGVALPDGSLDNMYGSEGSPAIIGDGG